MEFFRTDKGMVDKWLNYSFVCFVGVVFLAGEVVHKSDKVTK